MYLSIDLGDKRCGIAVYVQGVVVPKGIVLRPKLITQLRKLLPEYNVQKIIVGLPYDLHGRDMKQLDKTQNFIQKMKSIFPQHDIIGHDERFTSFGADIILKDMGVKDTTGKKDDLSALLILESYLQQKNII